MGYDVFQGNSRFSVPKAGHELALDRLKSVAGCEPIADSSGPHFSFIDQSAFGRAVELVGALHAWRWEAEQAEGDGSIVGIQFLGEKLGDEDLLFSAIAPHVEAGSFIEMIGEDGAFWRWVFDGQYVYKVFANVDFPEQVIGDRLDLDELKHSIIFRRGS